MGRASTTANLVASGSYRSIRLGEHPPLPTWIRRCGDFSGTPLALAEKLASRKRPAAVVSARQVKLVGGDSAREVEVSRSKSQLSRTNLLGRTSPVETHVAVSASHRLLKHPARAWTESWKLLQKQEKTEPGSWVMSPDPGHRPRPRVAVRVKNRFIAAFWDVGLTYAC